MRYIFLLLILSSISAQAKVVKDKQVWANINTFIQLKNDWQLYLEVQPRIVKDYEKHGTTLYRGAIGRSIGNGFSAWAGYGFIERTSPSYLHEDRPFLQLMHNADLNTSLKLVNRTRAEGRIFRDFADPAYRFRHLLRAQFRFSGTKWGLVAYDEWFWNSNNVSGVVREGFDQNRAFFGLSRYMGDKDQHLAEAGYMNQYVNGSVNDSSNDVLALQLTMRF